MTVSSYVSVQNFQSFKTVSLPDRKQVMKIKRVAGSDFILFQRRRPRFPNRFQSLLKFKLNLRKNMSNVRIQKRMKNLTYEEHSSRKGNV